MKIALYARYIEETSRQQFVQLTEILHRNGVMTEEVTETLPDKHFDFLFSIGGDGTLLSSVHLIGNRNIPVLGINFGHLGFLTTAGRYDIDTLVLDLLAGRYSLEPRTMIHMKAITPEGKNMDTVVLNEVSLHRLDDGSLLSTDLFVDDDFVATYAGDGLIVATPTGSTAYSLSCGGPILTPNSACFVITPNGTHNLTLRPIIVPDSAKLKLVTHTHSQDFNLGTDSRRQHLPCGTELILEREKFSIQLVRLHNQSFFKAIHQKLGWNF
ncbi:MAG: NAD(+)/NADH kinase [Bacteroidales bacterium]|nr:NAD(+)/NADH kinase [Candidatus Colimorpha merdihippi]MCQ2281502.1 NAD(+)/NADH kinase [Bacteroidales bacterium]